jgi:hypothetical protein
LNAISQIVIISRTLGFNNGISLLSFADEFTIPESERVNRRDRREQKKFNGERSQSQSYQRLWQSREAPEGHFICHKNVYEDRGKDSAKYPVSGERPTF